MNLSNLIRDPKNSNSSKLYVVIGVLSLLLIFFTIAIVTIWLVFQKRLSNLMNGSLKPEVPIKTNRADELESMVETERAASARAFDLIKSERMFNQEANHELRRANEPVYEDIELSIANPHRMAYDQLEFPVLPNSPRLQHYNQLVFSNSERIETQNAV